MSFKQFEKRNKTLLVEYKNQFKSNSFNDKRIGENDQNLSLEDKMFKRFVAERKKGRKTSKYNLNDDEDASFTPTGFTELTHGGQSLAQIENFERVDLSDDEKIDPDDPERGKISAEFVSENFFGGFKATDAESKQMNRKEWIDEMILKSKKLKYERQKERDKTLDMTEELDKEWGQLQPLINVMLKQDRAVGIAAEKDEFENPKKPDEYDVNVKMLMFDDKSKPTDKTKTDAEIEKEQQEELLRIEKEMMERMEHELDTEEVGKTKKIEILKPGLRKLPTNHRSVDDMDFDDPDYTQLKVRDELKHKHKVMKDENERAEAEEKLKKIELEDAEAKIQPEGEEEGDEESGQSENESSGEDTDEEDAPEQENSESAADFQGEKWISKFESVCHKLNKNLIGLIEFEKTIRALMVHLDPSKDEKNKERMCVLTGHLVDYYMSLFNLKSASFVIDMKIVYRCTSFIYELISKYGGKSTKEQPSMFIAIFRKLLGELNSAYMELKWNEKKFPQLNILFLFKLVATIFPTSDFRHQITTPCLLIMNRYLMECSVQTVADCFRGLFLTNLCHEFIDKSKRFIPECIQYLNGMLYLSVDWSNSKNQKLSQYETSTLFESFKTTKISFVVTEKITNLNSVSLSLMSQIDIPQINQSTRASIIGYTIDLIIAYARSYELNECFAEIFSITDILLALLPIDNYPKELTTRVKSLQDLIEDRSVVSREHLKCLEKKPVGPRMLEPKIQAKSKFDPRHHNSVISEKQLMTKKYKKEHKAAIKEVRLDTQFLARVQLKDQLAKDAKRSQKVKEIMGSLATQEGEYQKIKRMKN